MTAQACIKTEQRAEFMPKPPKVPAEPPQETPNGAYERHMAIVRATLNQEVSKAGRTWEESTHRQRFQMLQLASGDLFCREEIERVFTLDWVDLPDRYKKAYEQILKRFVEYVVKHGWAK